MVRLLRYLKGYRAAAVIAPLFKIIEAMIELAIPLLVADMIDRGLGGEGNITVIVWTGVILIALGGIGLGFSLSCQYLASKAAVGLGCNIRAALYSHIQRLSPGDIDRLGTGTLVTRLSTDVSQAQQGFAMFIRLILRAPVIAIGAVIMSVIVAPHIWYVPVVATALAMGTLILVMLLSVPRYTKAEKMLDNVSQITGETIRGERVIRAFAAEKSSEKKFNDAAARHNTSSAKASLVSCLLSPLGSVIINLSVVFILWLGGGTVISSANSFTQGDLIALVNYMSQILLALITISTLLVIVSKAMASGARINAIFDMPEMPKGSGAVPDPDAPLVELRNAAFSFGGDNAVGGLNFTLRRGEVLGVIGTTGSGKSVLAGMLTRFYRATEGEVLLAGRNILDYTDGQICSLVTYAPQKPLLFSGTVRSNLGLGGESDDERMNDALAVAEAAGFLSEKQGLDTVVNQKGSNFSGGEKQRISLARALLKDAPILILDDAASALDYVTEARVMKKVLGRATDKTVINISQRPGTVRHADKILVLDGGKVVGFGAHDELMRTCSLYARMVGSV